MPDVEEDRLWQLYLLDQYGPLLSKRQRLCFELYAAEDLSLTEIAENCGISRQGAWDNVRRAASTMEKYEEKTGLARRLWEIRQALERMRGCAAALRDESEGEARTLAEELCRQIEELERSDGL